MTYARNDSDKIVLDDLLEVVNPDDQDIVTLGAITMRYNYPHPLAVLAQDIGEGWGLTPFQLNKKCREIWSGGFRPSLTDYGVGSSNDVQQEES